MSAHQNLMSRYEEALRDITDERVRELLQSHNDQHEEHMLELENLVFGFGGGGPVIIDGKSKAASVQMRH